MQRELPGAFLLDVGYVANSAHHLGGWLDNLNQVDPKYLTLGPVLNAPLSSAAGQATGIPLPYSGFTGTVAQALRPYPQYQSIYHDMQTLGKSHYNSLQVKLQRQFHNGISVLASYTYSKLMTDAENQEGWYDIWGGGRGGIQNSFNRAAEFGVANSNPPQNLALSYVIELPFGTGKRFVREPGVARAVLGGWSISGVQHYQSGTPLAISSAGNTPIFNWGLRPNIVAGQPLRASWSGRFDPAKDVYANAAAFSVPPDYTFGNAATILPLRGFSYFNEDIALHRRFRVTESIGAEFRVDAFNLFNRADFANPDMFYSPTNTDFGHTGSQANSPRSVQFAVTIHF